MKLLFAIVYTSDIDRMSEYYRERLGFETASESPFFVQFRSGPTSLSLLAIPHEQPRQFELCFVVDDLESAIAERRRHGMEFVDDIREQPFGRLIHARDPEDNVVTLLQPNDPFEAAGAPELSTVIVNTWDYGSTINFYRDRLGLAVLNETPHWTELSTGGARIAVHARAGRPDLPMHASQKVAFAFAVDDVDGWTQEAAERGLRLTTPPTPETFGTYAEAMDPDDNIVVFREPPTAVPAPDSVAEAFEDDAVPVKTGMRKPLSKRSKAVSRVAIRPEYQKKRTSARSKTLARRTAAARAVAGNGAGSGKLRLKKVRGGGPDRTRAVPKNTSDVKRAKAKPAIGRLQKKKLEKRVQQKRAVAGASKGRPVKRAAAKRTRRSR